MPHASQLRVATDVEDRREPGNRLDWGQECSYSPTRLRWRTSHKRHDRPSASLRVPKAALNDFALYSLHGG